MTIKYGSERRDGESPSTYPTNAVVITVTVMKKDPDKEELLQEIARLKQELRSKSIDLKRTEMARDAYERMIVLAEERYGIPIRKKFDLYG